MKQKGYDIFVEPLRKATWRGVPSMMWYITLALLNICSTPGPLFIINRSPQKSDGTMLLLQTACQRQRYVLVENMRRRWNRPLSRCAVPLICTPAQSGDSPGGR